jgi:interferon gamma-inducible protein 30
MKQTMKLLITIYLISLTLQDVPKIDVFIESLCPDCMQFIQTSFIAFNSNPSRTELANVTFYSYGNAHESWDGSKWVFTCQHKENECYGNVIETCAQSKLEKDDYHNFLICLEGDIRKSGKDFNVSTRKCLKEDLAAAVIDCAVSDEGNRLEHAVAQKTPEHKYVPWIVVNGVHDTNLENRILENMTKYLCEGRPELEGCKGDLELASVAIGRCPFIPLEFLKFNQ